jgi:hypothetical protein
MARTNQPYTPCKLYIDGADGLAVGDYIVTSGGSAYLVQSVRGSPTKPDRRYMHCLRWPIGKVPAEAKCYRLNWYRR